MRDRWNGRSDCWLWSTLQDAPLAIQILFSLLSLPPPGAPLRSTAASTPSVTHVLSQRVRIPSLSWEGGTGPGGGKVEERGVNRKSRRTIEFPKTDGT